MPGTEIALVEQATTRAAPTDTGVAFFVGAAGQAASGVQFPARFVNLEQAIQSIGERAPANSTLLDSLEVFFREGGSTAYVTGATQANPTAQNYADALDLFQKELGPGQVLAPGIATIHAELLAHAAANHRVALLDGPDSANPTTITTAHDALDDDENVRFGAFFGNWVVVNGLTPGTTRTLPPSPIVAGLIARSDRTNNPNVAAAGDNGISRTAIRLAQTLSNTDADTLNEGSVNLFRSVFGNIELYGYRSVVKKVDDPDWWMFTNVRLYMAIAARSEPALHSALFAQLDGQRRRLGQLEGEESAVLLDFYNEGALYGTDPTEAFSVDATSEAVNPPEQLEQGLVRVVANVRMSPFGERVRLELSKTRITEALPA